MKRLRFPGTFCVGSDILKDFKTCASCYGKKMVFIGGQRSLEAAREQLEAGFETGDGSCHFITCKRVASLPEIERISKMPEVADADVLCAVGGGSCMDITRTIANRQNKGLIMIPTTVASDAPCSFVSVFYSEDGNEVVGDELYHKCPDMVFVDSKVIAEAPTRQIAAGMGDALATYYEAMTCYKNPGGTSITETAVTLGALCRDIVLRDGMAAFSSVRQHIVTPQLENVIEANCFLSGVGGANTGCAAAHGIGDYLCRVPGGHKFMHGERVYIGLMIQMILEKYPMEELVQLMDFGRAVGLPTSIRDLGITEIHETAQAMAAGLQGDHFMVNLCCDHTENILAGAIVYAADLAEHLKEA